MLHSLHDKLCHWDVAATDSIMMDRFWWPGVSSSVAQYVKTCDSCQRRQTPRHYKTPMSVYQSNIFGAFSIDFTGLFPTSVVGNRYLLVGAEHLTVWQVVAATRRATSETVIMFIKEKILVPFGPLGVVVSDNAACSTARALQALIEDWGSRWKTVLAFAPMSNGRAERMAGTIKKGVEKFVGSGSDGWDTAVQIVVF